MLGVNAARTLMIVLSLFGLPISNQLEDSVTYEELKNLLVAKLVEAVSLHSVDLAIVKYGEKLKEIQS